MDYAAWKLFIDASAMGSLSKVAIAYGTSQPHISRRIADLEKECGGRLFQRTGRGVALTELGQRILPKVRTWLAGTDQLANDVRTSAGTPIGTVRIGCLPSTAHPLVTTLYYRMHKHYPRVQLAIREGQGAQLETWLEDGSVDLAFLFRSATSPRNDDTPLVETQTYLVSAEGDPLTRRPTVPFKAIDGLPLVTFCRPNSWWNRLDQLAQAQGITLNVVLEADSLSLQTHVVADGGIYALLGRYAITAGTRTSRIHASRIEKPAITRHIALALSKHGEMTLACRTVMQVAREIARSGGAGLPVA